MGLSRSHLNLVKNFKIPKTYDLTRKTKIGKKPPFICLNSKSKCRFFFLNYEYYLGLQNSHRFTTTKNRTPLFSGKLLLLTIVLKTNIKWGIFTLSV